MKKWVKFSELDNCYRALKIADENEKEEWIEFNDDDFLRSNILLCDDVIDIYGKICYYSSIENLIQFV